MNLENINNIDLIKDAYYLCHAPSYHESGYVIAQCISKIKCSSSPHKILVLEMDNRERLYPSDILGLIKL